MEKRWLFRKSNWHAVFRRKISHDWIYSCTFHISSHCTLIGFPRSCSWLCLMFIKKPHEEGGKQQQQWYRVESYCLCLQNKVWVVLRSSQKELKVVHWRKEMKHSILVQGDTNVSPPLKNHQLQNIHFPTIQRKCGCVCWFIAGIRSLCWCLLNILKKNLDWTGLVLLLQYI